MALKSCVTISLDFDIASSLITKQTNKQANQPNKKPKQKPHPNPKPCDDNRQVFFKSYQSRRV